MAENESDNLCAATPWGDRILGIIEKGGATPGDGSNCTRSSRGG